MILPIIKKVINFPEAADKTFTHVPKVTGATTRTAGSGKGSVDFLVKTVYLGICFCGRCSR